MPSPASASAAAHRASPTAADPDGVIAAVRNEAGNVVGIMPHPEHAVEDLTGPGTDGLGFFTSVLTAMV